MRKEKREETHGEINLGTSPCVKRLTSGTLNGGFRSSQAENTSVPSRRCKPHLSREQRLCIHNRRREAARYDMCDINKI